MALSQLVLWRQQINNFSFLFVFFWSGTMHFRLAVLAAVSIASVSLQSASAADMPAKAPTAVPVTTPLHNWSGFYFGGVVGYGWGRATHCDASPTTFCEPVTDPKGWNGGLTLGYNWQWTNWVLGIEGDLSWADLNAASASTAGFGCAPAGADGCRTKIKSYETLRGRLGWAFDRVLPYVTAGAAWTQLHASIGNPTVSSGSATKTSFAVGAGIEYALWRNLSAKVEYLYIAKPGDFAYDTNGACGTPGCFVRVGGINEIRFGLNYKFGPLI
jgi:outer membrane immunogenic protein